MQNELITYETIYEFLRNEKNKDALQKLNDNFFINIGNYLAEKEKILKDTAAKTDVFSKKETEKITTQIHNVRSILTDIYTRRERKIIELAINLVRTRSSVIDTSNIHNNEKVFFDSIVKLLEEYRGSILQDLLTAKVTHVKQDTPDELSLGKKVEFLSAVDAFLDRELKEFGPFSQNDTAVIPNEIADILISEGKAKEI